MHSPSHFESGPESFSLMAQDLDDALLQGDVGHLSDEELAEALLNPAVVNKLKEARAQGIRVVMLTRNPQLNIERFFRAHPEARELFDDVLSSYGVAKSTILNAYLENHQLEPEDVLFVDDTELELKDVEQNVSGSTVCLPTKVSDQRLKLAKKGRRRFRNTFLPSGSLQSNEVELAA